MLNFVTGFSKDLFTAKERALEFYNNVGGRKNFLAVESQLGTNELNEPAWYTTIWYNVPELTPEEKKKEAQKYLFIGSDDIDPQDPDWREKFAAKQEAKAEAIDVEDLVSIRC